jgi:hypothetical protein
MGRLPGEISRDELLAKLHRDRVTRPQLLRWQERGLFPRPRIDGHGRGRGGSTSYYPRLAVLQARLLVRLLRHNRSLVEAGWVLWVLGFREPTTEWSRKLLVGELQAGLAASRREYGRDRKGIKATVFSRAAGKRPLKGTERMRRVIAPEAVGTVFRMLAEMQLGVLPKGQYGEREWSWFQDAVLAEVLPDLLDTPGTPGWQEVEAGITRLSKSQNTPSVIQALMHVDEAWLRALMNEAQLLWELIVQPSLAEPGVIPRDDFLRYFKFAYVNPETRPAARELRQAMGWTRPPESPLRRAHEEAMAARQKETASPTASRSRQ